MQSKKVVVWSTVARLFERAAPGGPTSGGRVEESTASMLILGWTPLTSARATRAGYFDMKTKVCHPELVQDIPPHCASITGFCNKGFPASRYEISKEH